MIKSGLYIGLVALAINPMVVLGQQPFALDPSFRVPANDWYVSSIAPAQDGGLLLSGRIRWFANDIFKTVVKVFPNGQRDLSFYESGLGGGKLVEWDNKFYAQGIMTVRRINPDGTQDVGFQFGAPYVLPLQGGDYHVYPDGSLLISGAHTVNHPDSGWNGIYNLIWFTNTGRMDSTRAPRKGNGVIYDILELPDGKFICTGPMTVYEGQPTSHVFRVHADGTLDTSFFAGVEWGQAWSYLPLADGRCYVGGLMRFNGSSVNRTLVRLLPDGSLDPSFNNDVFFDKGVLSGQGAIAFGIYPLSEGKILVTGRFQAVDGIPHNGLCILDSTGQVVPQLEDQGCGIYVYQSQNSSTTYASIEGAYFMPDNMMYVWGAYHGYNDGITNDPLQRFVTRLYGPDFSTGVEELPGEEAVLQVYPNPARDRINVSLPRSLPSGELLLRDALGRILRRQVVSGNLLSVDVHGLGDGLYLLELRAQGQLVGSTRLVVQH